MAACEVFSSVEHVQGLEINPVYASSAQVTLSQQPRNIEFEILVADFFQVDWESILAQLHDPILIIGNPPWVTNSAIGTLQGSNLPKKSNFQNHQGLDALTGKSNFDVSEWMILHLAKQLRGRKATLAMLCKTTVARKVLLQGWRESLLGHSEIRRIDSKKHFGASVDACLLLCQIENEMSKKDISRVYPNLSANKPMSTIGLRNDKLVSNLSSYDETSFLAGISPWKWRSGIKHDCARVMELRKVGDKFRNGLNELIDLEEDFLYPALKSSDVAAGRVDNPQRWMIVTQQLVGQDTRPLQTLAPKTWNYLVSHSSKFDRRGSSIYKNKPPFAIFGVGDYSFAPYKLAVSGMYKHLSFSVVCPSAGKTVVLDDTCSFLPFQTKEEAEFAAELLSSALAQDFYESRIFWDTKRPITNEVLNQLNLVALACAVSPRDPITLSWNQRLQASDGGQRALF